jgi:hypothetical protein
MLTAVAFCVFQLSVTGVPGATLVEVAVNERMTGVWLGEGFAGGGLAPTPRQPDIHIALKKQRLREMIAF